MSGACSTSPARNGNQPGGELQSDILEALATGVMIIDKATTLISYINRAGADYLGMVAAETQGLALTDIGHELFKAPRFLDFYRRGLDLPPGSHSLAGEFTITATVRSRTFELRAQPLNEALLLLSFQDVTAFQQSDAEAARTENVNRIISYFATSLLEQHTEEDIVWDLAKNCVSQLGFVDCVIYLVNPEGTALLQKAAFGPKSPEGRQLLNPIAIPMGTGIVGSVASSRRMELVADTSTDPRYIVDDQLRLSELAVPIIANDRVLGVIDSEHPDRDFFTGHHVMILKAIASLCANKLVRVHAESELHRLNLQLEQHISVRTHELWESNQRLRQEIAERSHAEKVQKALYQLTEAIHTTKDLPSLYSRIHSIIETLMPARNFYIALMDATGLITFPYHVDEADPVPPPRRGRRGMTEYVLRRGESALVNLDDIELLKRSGEYIQSGHPAKIWLGVPLTAGGRTFGVMAVQDHYNALAFGEAEKKILAFVAGQTAFAIERKHTEEALHRSADRLRGSEERFSKAFQSSPCLMCLTRMDDGTLMDANEALLAALGRTAEEVIGKTTTELGLWATNEERKEFLAELQAKGSVRNHERRWIIGEQPRVFLHSAEVINLESAACLLTVAVDVTESKKAEAELLKALDSERKLSQLKSSFITTVSHEFRTPLEIIMSSSEILDRYLDRLGASERKEHLQAIHQAVKRMSDLMEEVLLLGKVEAGKVEFENIPIELPTFCQRLIEEIRAATDDRCPIHFRAVDLPERRASGDESLLRHILLNLLSNAVKYSAPGSPVELVVMGRGNQAHFQIKDRGCGIPSADHEYIFQAFQRGRNVAKIAGSGLGLVIAKRCVELHNGRIRFQSVQGKGTTFDVLLPCFPGEENAASTDTSWFYKLPDAGKEGV